MFTALERLGIFARAPDARPPADIKAEIDAELAFHLEESARELEKSGFAPDAARDEARRRFGHTERFRRECARTQLGERFMVQRLHFLLTGLLIAIVGFLWLGTRRAQAEIEAHRSANQELMHRFAAEAERLAALPGTLALTSNATQPAGAGHYKAPDGREMDLPSAAGLWSEKFDQSDAWRHGLRVTEQLAALPDTQGPEILARLWLSLVVAHREQAMKPFVFHGGHPFALEVLDLGLRDPDSSVRERAQHYVRTYAWRDLSKGESAVDAWMAQWRDKPVQEVVAANARLWARELGDMMASWELIPAETAEPHLSIVDDVRLETLTTLGIDLATILREAGVCDPLSKALGLSDTVTRTRGEKVLEWCRP